MRLGWIRQHNKVEKPPTIASRMLVIYVCVWACTHARAHAHTLARSHARTHTPPYPSLSLCIFQDLMHISDVRARMCMHILRMVSRGTLKNGRARAPRPPPVPTGGVCVCVYVPEYVKRSPRPLAVCLRLCLRLRCVICVFFCLRVCVFAFVLASCVVRVF